MIFPLVISIGVGVAAWFTLIAFTWLLGAIGLVQAAYVRGVYKWLAVLSADFAFIAWALESDTEVICAVAAMPWFGYLCYLNARRVSRKRARLQDAVRRARLEQQRARNPRSPGVGGPE